MSNTTAAQATARQIVKLIGADTLAALGADNLKGSITRFSFSFEGKTAEIIFWSHDMYIVSIDGESVTLEPSELADHFAVFAA